MTEVLVVGYGSPLRSDDAAGRVVAEEIEEMGLNGVEVRVMTQLVPELVEAMAGRNRVIFVDATVDSDQLGVSRVERRHSHAGSHHADPGALMALMTDIGMQPPETYLVSVPAVDVSLGEGLSPGTRKAVREAVDAVRGLVGATT